MEQETPKKKGRPPKQVETDYKKQQKEKDERKQKKKSLALTDIEVKRQLEVVTQKFLANPQPFFEEKRKEIAVAIEKYGDLQAQDLENGVITKKDYVLKLTENIVKPLIPRFGNAMKHSPLTLQSTNEFYWTEIVLPLSEKVNYVPNIHDLLALLNISSSTFRKYAVEGDEDMTETCQMIKDKFIGYYQRKGLTKELNEIMAMFVLKTTFQQRENEVPQVVVANVVASPQEKIDKYARQYGFEKWDGE